MALIDDVQVAKQLYLSLLDSNTYGEIHDADTILAEIMTDPNLEWQINEIGLDCLNIYNESSDRESVAEMFYLLTDVPFQDFVQRCINETTRTGGEVI